MVAVNQSSIIWSEILNCPCGFHCRCNGCIWLPLSSAIRYAGARMLRDWYCWPRKPAYTHTGNLCKLQQHSTRSFDVGCRYFYANYPKRKKCLQIQKKNGRKKTVWVDCWTVYKCLYANRGGKESELISDAVELKLISAATFLSTENTAAMSDSN